MTEITPQNATEKPDRIVPRQEIADIAVDPLLAMIERAARDPSVDIDKMERLFQMHERATAQRAKAEFLAAFARMQMELPAAARRGTGHNSKKYARFEDVIETIREPLSKNGFSLSFRLQHDQASISVTGVLGHASGHTESTTMTLKADASGNKNEVQAWGSAVSYGKRYVALTLLGVATEDDDDGSAAAKAPDQPITAEQVEALRKAIDDAGADIPRFCRYFKIEALGALPQSQLDRALKSLASKRAKA